MEVKCYRWLVVLAAAIAAAGCTQTAPSYAVDVDPHGWQQPAVLMLPNSDTLTLRDVGIFLRCNDRFSEDTLTLRVETISPDSLHVGEYLCIPFPHETFPAAIAREAAALYRNRVCFGQTGDYRMILTPTRPVRGVEAVGIHIEATP